MSRFTDRTRPLRVGIVSAFAGGATLAGEVLGSRLLRPVVGGASVAQSGAIAGALGGLGLGAWLVGGALSPSRPPRRVLDVSLLALIVLTLAAPTLAELVAPTAARVLVSLGAGRSSLSTVVAAAIAMSCALPFGALSGALYPPLAQLHGHGAGRATGLSGAMSSLGSALAVLGITFVVAPTFGVRTGLYASAVLYACGLLVLRTFDASDTGPAPAQREPARPSSRSTRRKARRAAQSSLANTSALVSDGAPSSARVSVALACVGAASILWQFGLARLGVLAFGASAFALAAATSAHTFSLAIGELVASRVADRISRPRAAWISIATLGALAALTVIWIAPSLPSWSARWLPGTVRSMTSLWSLATLLIALLMLPVITAVGAAMPLAARWIDDAHRADANARVLGPMALGNVVAALVGPLALVPRVGLRGTLLCAAGALGLAAAVASGRAVLRRRAIRAVAVLATFVFVVWQSPQAWRPERLATGPFLYAGSDVDLGRVLTHRDGREATVTVRQDEGGTYLLQIDGKVDATSTNDSATQLLVGLVPAMLCDRPRNVLVIGVGSGMTVDAVRSVPGVSRVVATELLPEVVAAARSQFRSANHGALDARGVEVLAVDASLYLRGSRETFDVIVSEPSNPWVLGMADLFTAEAIAAAHARLRPGGAMAMWFHAHSTDAQTFASIVATFREQFPRAALFEMVPGQDYMIVGIREPARVDVDRVAALFDVPAVRTQLMRAGLTERASFFGRFVAGADGVRAIAEAGSVLRAADLRLEFRAPSLLYRDATAEIFALFRRAQDLPLAGLGAQGSQYAAILEESEPVREASLHARQMALALNARDLDAAIREGEIAVAAAPRDASVRDTLARVYVRRAGRRYRSRDPGGAQDDLRSALELRPGGAERFRANVVLGDMALARDDDAHAAQYYGAALDIALETGAEVPELHLRMSQILRRLGDLPHALAELDRAIRQSTDVDRVSEMQRLRSLLMREPGAHSSVSSPPPASDAGPRK